MLEAMKKGYIGNAAQLVTIRRVTLNEGRARGVEVIEIKNADGLELDILPSTGLDIGQCRYKGINMSWMSKNGYDSPAVINPFEDEFGKSFPGGLLFTCGLRSAGPGNRDQGEWHPLHGRYHEQSAEQVCAEVENGEIVVKGLIRETANFGHLFEVRRKIRISVFGAEIKIEDTICNNAARDEEYMQIYHCNFGYPLLSEKARLVLPEDRETIPRTDFAAEFIADSADRALAFNPPIPNEEERCFFQKMKKEFWARLENPDLGVNMTISWDGSTLPVMTEWRSMASGDYVLGLEPTNCYVMGRHEERENGTLQVIKSFESVTNKVEIKFEQA